MALGMERIAGLMASTGANIGSQMTGLGALGNRLGNILADAPGDIRQKQMQQEANAFLQANKNNPQALAAKATEYATAGNDYLAKAFQKASEVAGAQRTAQVQTTLNALERARLGATTLKQKKAIEQRQADLAQSIGLSVGDYLGKSEAEDQQDVINRAARVRAEAEIDEQATQTTLDAYIKGAGQIDVTDPEKVAKFSNQAPPEIRTDVDNYLKGLVESSRLQEEIAERRADMQTGVDIKALRKQTENIPEWGRPSVDAAFSAVEKVKEQYWNESTGTWNTGGSNRAKAALKNLETVIANVYKTGGAAKAQENARIRSKIRSLRYDIDKYRPSQKDIEARMEETGLTLQDAEQELINDYKTEGIKQIKRLKAALGEDLTASAETSQTTSDDQFVVGEIYVDAQGNRAKYLGDGQFEEMY